MENDELQVDVQPEENEQEVEITLEEESPTEETVESEAPATEEKDWKAEALKQKAINQRLSKKLEKPVASPEKSKQDLPKKEDDDIRETVESLKLAEQKRQFGYEHKLSPEETDAVFKLSPNPTKETLEDDFVKGGLERLRSKNKVAENTPSSSSRSASFKLPKKEDLSKEDKQKAFEEYKAKRLGR